MNRCFLIVALLFSVTTGATAAEPTKESAYERVMRTNTLRCGYMTWPGIFSKHPNTGEFAGIMKDLMDTVAKGTQLKIEWAAEVGYSDVPAALAAQKIDAYCFPYTPLLPRLRGATFTKPFFFVRLNTYAKSDDNRFDNNVDLINDPKTKVSSMDGEMSGIIARQNFPKATLLETPLMNGAMQPLLDVAGGKADVTFSEAITTEEFMAANPDKIKIVPGGAIGAFPCAMGVATNELQLKALLDEATQSLLDTGYVSGLIKKYGFDNKLLPAASAYQN